jgi:hypothetical protein
MRGSIAHEWGRTPMRHRIRAELMCVRSEPGRKAAPLPLGESKNRKGTRSRVPAKDAHARCATNLP